MKIYDGSMVEVACYQGSSLIGFELGRSSSSRCPFCGAIPQPMIFTKSKCSQCGAEYKQSSTGGWYWERDLEMPALKIEHLKLMLEGEKLLREAAEDFLTEAKRKITSRNRIIKSLRAALQKNNVRT